MFGRTRALVGILAPAFLLASIALVAAAELISGPTDALWVARSGGLTQVATADAQPVRAIEIGADARAVAIDEALGSVWAYSEGRLHAFGPDGARWLDAAVEGPTGVAPVDLLVDTSVGVVWLAAGKDLYRYSTSGGFQGKRSFKQPIDALAWDSANDRLWVASKQTLTVLDAAGTLVRAQDLGQGVTIRDAAFDAHLGAVWVSTQTQLLRFAADGTPQLAVALAAGSPVRSLHPDLDGGLWAHDAGTLVHLGPDGAITRTIVVFPAETEDERIVDATFDPAHGTVWIASKRFLREYGLDGALRHELTLSTGGPFRIFRLTAFGDREAPSIVITAPADGAILDDAQPPVALAFLDGGAGIDLASLEATLDGAPVALTCTGDDESAECAFPQPLADGEHTLAVTVADLAGNRSAPASVAFTVDTTALVLTVTAPADGLHTNQTLVAVRGSVSKPATVRVDGALAELTTELGFEESVALAEGANSIVVTARDAFGRTARVERTVHRDTVAPEPVAVAGLAIGLPVDGLVTVTGGPGSAEPGTTVRILNTRTGDAVTAPVAADGSFSAVIAAERRDALALVVIDAAGNESTALPGTVPGDVTAPTLTILAPAADAFVASATPGVELGYADDDSGVDPASLQATLDGAPIALACDAQPAAATCALPAPLAEGEHLLAVSLADLAGNRGAAVERRFTVDLTPPVVALTGPTSPTKHASRTLTGTVSEPATLALGDQALVHDAELGFSTPITLIEGENAFRVVATDRAGNQGEATRVVVLDTVAPALSLDAPTDGLQTNQTTVSVDGAVDGPATVEINGALVALDSEHRFTTTVELLEGGNIVLASATDAAGNSAQVTRTVVRDTALPLAPDLGLIQVSHAIDGIANVTGGAGSVEGGSTVRVRNLRTGQMVTVTANADGSFSVAIGAQPGDLLQIQAIDAAGNASETRDTAVTDLPPDPSLIAPPLAKDHATLMHEAVAFLYSGPNAIQTGVAPGAVDPLTVAVVRGKLITRDGAPLAGVTIAVKDHPELGQTRSRADGRYDLVLNGGGATTLQFSKDDYLPAQRTVPAPQQDYLDIDDVALVQLDPVVSIVDLNSPAPYQVARSSVVTDEDGSRQLTLLFPQGTTATITRPDGTTQQLETLSVRATEYTVGPNGEAAMPGDLPKTSAYTYAVELSVDEQLTGGVKVAGKDVVFNQTVYSYVDNFVGFPAGTIVPSGYYDPDAAIWRSSPDGIVVKVVSETGGLALLDTNGDGTADNAARYAELQITDGERAQLATLYAPGQSLWRMPLTHFSTKDYNLPAWFPSFLAPLFQALGLPPNSPCQNTASGSIVKCQSQTLGEQVAITGTPITATYMSDRVPGRRAAYEYEVKMTGEEGAVGVARVVLEVQVAGRKFTKYYTRTEVLGAVPFQNLKDTFEWDGIDAYGRPVTGPQTATIRVGFELPVMYGRMASDSSGSGVCLGGPCPSGRGSFGKTASEGLSLMWARGERQGTIWRDLRTTIGTLDSRGVGLGGWTLDVHHNYAPGAQRLYTGDGDSRDFSNMTGVMELVAGNGCTTIPLTFPTGNARTACFQPNDISVGPDGRIYFLAQGTANVDRIGRIERNGTIGLFTSVGKPIKDIRWGKDGRLYASTSATTGAAWADTVYRVDDDGSVTRVVGNNTALPQTTGATGNPTIGAPATETSFAIRSFDVHADGTLIIVHANNWDSNPINFYRIVPGGTVELMVSPGGGNIFRDISIGPDGSMYYGGGAFAGVNVYRPDGQRVRFVGKNGAVAGTGDGGPAIDSGLQGPSRLRTTRNGELYILESTRLRRVTADGIINRIAGGGDTPEANSIGAPAIYAILESATTFDVDQATGTVYLASPSKRRIYAVRQSLPSFDGQTLTIASKDGGELYTFDAAGRHLSTKDTMTGATRFAFGYDAAGRLVSITDVDDEITLIERDGMGNPTAIVAPDGQRTTIGVNGEGFIASFTNPANEAFQATYLTGGLMDSFTTPRGHTSHMTYSPKGLLRTDANAAGGGWTVALERVDMETTSRLTTAEGRTKSFHTAFEGTRTEVQTNTEQDGTVTTLRIGSNFLTESTAPDGTTMTAIERNDPRFKMQATVPTSTVVELPSGLTSTVTQGRSAVLADATNPLSLTSQTDTVTVNGKATRTVYTASNRTYTTTSAQNRISSVQVDAKGKPIQSQVTGLAGAVHGYDDRGRLETVTVGSGVDARTTRFTYHASGHQAGWIATVTDAESRTVSFEYDLAGRVLKQTLPGNREIGYRYDANGNLIGITPPGKGEHAFSYTAIDLEGEYTPPDVVAGSDATVYGYDRDKLLRSVTRPDGAVVGFEYGADGKLDTLTTSTGVTAYSYDEISGRLASMSAPGGEGIAYSYDGFLLTQVQSTGTVNGAVGYRYDSDFRVEGLAVNGVEVTFGYDLDSMLTRAGAMTISRHAQHGLITGTTLGSSTTALSYNGFGELASAEAKQGTTSLFKEQITSRDKLGRIKSKVETVLGVANTYEFGYDLAGRLETVDRDGVRVSTYAYDSNGNRLSHNGTLGDYDAQDRMLSYGAASFTYTANGEIDTKTEGGQVTEYDYDALGNLRRVVMPNGQVIEYAIDGQNRRIGKKVDGVLVQGLLYQDQLEPVAELDGTGHVVARFVYGTKATAPDYMVKDGVTYRMVSDYLGSVRLVVNIADGTIAQRLRYDEYGVVLEDTNPGFQPFGYAGGIQDNNTGLTRFGARDYDPISGRWTAKDPIGNNSHTTNRYEYALGSPTEHVDPSGRIVPLAVALVAAGGAINAGSSAYSAWRNGASATTVLATAGKGFVSGAVGTAAALAVGAATKNVALAGAAGGAASAEVDQFFSGESDPASALAQATVGALTGGIANKLLPTKGRLPNLLPPRALSQYGKNSQRLLGQEGIAGALGASLSEMLRNLAGFFGGQPCP